MRATSTSICHALEVLQVAHVRPRPPVVLFYLSLIPPCIFWATKADLERRVGARAIWLSSLATFEATVSVSHMTSRPLERQKVPVELGGYGSPKNFDATAVRYKFL